jgi:hypothetical protein
VQHPHAGRRLHVGCLRRIRVGTNDLDGLSSWVGSL